MSLVAPMPTTTFPGASAPSDIDEKIGHLLINSDPNECNTNLLTVLKAVLDELKVQPETYYTCSVFALKLLCLNLMVKNVNLCLGKLLGMVQVLSGCNDTGHETESVNLKQLVLIILLLLLKVKPDKCSLEAGSIDAAQLLTTLRLLNFAKIMGDFITEQVQPSNRSHDQFVILKFSCDIVFQYLYRVILFSEQEFSALTENALIPTLISHLLSNDNFNHYNLDEADFEDESKLIAYEEFKLLLLINEQYMMMSLSSDLKENKVFEGLLAERGESFNGISGFVNLLVYHLNREESHIFKILMLKFLYVIFTTSSSAKLPYLNDLKILVDIMIRELNDMSYAGDDLGTNSFLALAYLKVLYPMLTFSQISELNPSYKAAEIIDMLRNIVVNCDVTALDRSNNGPKLRIRQFEQASKLVKFAVMCLSIPWLKESKKNRLMAHSNASVDSVASTSSLSIQVANLNLDEASSSDINLLSQVASVLTSKRNNLGKRCNFVSEIPIYFEENDPDVFMSPKTPDSKDLDITDTVCLLDLPKLYLLNKLLPPLPSAPRKTLRSGNGSPYMSGDQFLTEHTYPHIMLGALSKPRKAPPPPPPPPRRRKQ